MKAKQKVAYIILGLGLPLNGVNRGKVPTTLSRNSCKTLGADLGTVYLSDQKRSHSKTNPHDYRWVLRFRNGQPNDLTAAHITESLDALLYFVYGPPSSDSPVSNYRIPENLVDERCVVRLPDLDKYDRTLPTDERFGELFFMTEIRASYHIPMQSMEEIWRLLPACSDKNIFQALAFLRASFSGVCFTPGQIHDILSFGEDSKRPSSARDAALFETAFLNAFKAIESVIGNPNKNDTRFQRQLLSAGLNPQDQIGYRNTVTLSTRIREMSTARDKRAAHGSTVRHANITQGELMEWQATARYVVYRAAEKHVSVPRKLHGKSLS